MVFEDDDVDEEDLEADASRTVANGVPLPPAGPAGGGRTGWAKVGDGGGSSPGDVTMYSVLVVAVGVDSESDIMLELCADASEQFTQAEQHRERKIVFVLAADCV